MTAPEKQVHRSDLEWEVEAALAWHDEYARATIATLLLDCKYLGEQLALHCRFPILCNGCTNDRLRNAQMSVASPAPEKQ
ncbi:hypothetical protein PYH37_006369 (plasmid) [Sinorhizobium numidicum]|uniref:Uncharacterized protein n=1 Tax=Sinorhizobium numidicum TaxID=680248 RepID=A0ABY8D660_9HYPH|nr:hypothetical protein [Sinorhizobium numidicum]WEX79457.1 hypothetical protein PYH37_006369 [Sinorhizobium numidicum]WEX85587.1 hypothetical protein PYH38_006015 [Sinorhizobium numidicum]